mmetsp:Transcript_84017/g.261019  ORF Transcript_84017/g.261019 Transcript_84017/m.261019 type:complete len:271 (+) Transcript_84017:408-1220(+)
MSPAARSMGVEPSMSCSCKSPWYCTRRLMARASPVTTAVWSGVVSSRLQQFGSASASRRQRATRRLPLRTATCSGRFSSASAALRSAPALTRSSTMARSALRSAARSRAEKAAGEASCLPSTSPSWRSTSARAFSSKRMASKFPSPAHRPSGGSNPSPRALGSARASRRTRSTALWPKYTDRCTAVTGASPATRALRSAECSANSRTRPAKPHFEAKCRAVRPHSSRSSLRSAFAMTMPWAFSMSFFVMALISGCLAICCASMLLRSGVR